MKRLVRLALTVSGVLVTMLALPAVGTAQGVTTGAVRGKVLDEAGRPVVGAVVTLVNAETGLRNIGTTRSSGQFSLENVTPGGPFTLTVRNVGFRPATQSGIRVNLGQVVTVDIKLTAAAVTLADIAVTGAADNPLLSRGRTGASVTISDSFISRLPTISRNFTDLISVAPQANGSSVGGQNNRYNNIQIDGGVNNDLFGLGSSGTPGGQVSARPISIEAIKEFQLLIAPFDVRQGGFTGGLVNAVTKSGTNTIHGSLFGFGQNQDLSRSEVDRGALGKDVLSSFHEYQYGGTLSGPIVKNKLHFFGAVDLKSRSAPFAQYLQNDVAIDSGAFGVTQAKADSVAAWSKANLVDAGTAGQVNRESPDHNIFVKLNGQVTAGSQIELSYNDVKASDGTLIRSSSFSGFRSGYELGNAGYTINNTTRTGRLRYNAVLGGGFTNELLLGYQRIRDLRDPGMNTPLIFVGGTSSGGGSAIAIGAERFSQGNVLKQDIYEVSDNLSISRGSHLITLGTHNEFFKFYDQFFPGSYGVWGFASAADLYAGTPNHYEIALPLRTNGPLAEFTVNQIGLYAQDIWNVTPKLSVTAGIRMDKPSLPTKPDANPGLAAIQFTHVNLGVTGTTDIANTADFSTASLISPRFGFNYDVNGDQSTLVRGGIGVFAGRPPYVWVANAYANSGLTQATLSCNGAAIPTFTTDLASQPTTCVGGGAPNPPKPSIVYFDHGFKFPQTMRAALGADHQLGWGMVATVDLLYTRTLNQFYLNDVNLKGVQSLEAGEGGRRQYGVAGTPNATTGIASAISPTRISSGYNDVIRQSNASGDNSYSATLQVNKRFSDGFSFNAGYTYSRTKDRECMTSSISNSNLRFAVLQGALDDRPLATSCFDVPHKLALTGIFNLPLGLQASLTYVGASSTPFTYTVNNDANGDGLSGNDPIYVPKTAADITLKNASDWTQLNSYISSDPCLDEARGTLLVRNACRGPWQSFMNARLTKVIPTLKGQALEISVDVFNLPNLLKSSWGVVRSTTGFENQAILNQTGYDVANQRGQYTLMNQNNLNGVVANSSRYKLLLSGKYTF
ncbi:MAG: carboxypeptidase regulatory-like domain-containing protein [Gemmatimonadota bacterium]